MVTWKRTLLALLMAFGAIACLPATALANTLVGGAITASTTWTTANSPYEVTSQVVVYNNAKLTIQPGVTVLFHTGTGLVIGYYGYDYSQAGTNQERGQLAVNGTAAQPVLFTSFSGLTGDWKGLAFGPSTDYGGLTSTVSYLTVEKAGQAQSLAGYAGTFTADIMMFNTGTGFPFDHVQANLSTGFGIYLGGSALTATAVTASGNTNVGVYAASSTLNLSGSTITGNAATGLFLGASGGTISGNTISSNSGYGIDSSGGSPTISGNTISGSGLYAIRYPVANAPVITGNTLTGNAQPGINVISGALTTNHAWSLQNGETLFTVTGGDIVVYNLAKLTVGGGSTVQFSSGTGLIIGYYNYDYSQAGTNQERGSLAVNGTAALPVLFTSTSGAAGGWKGLAFGAATDYSGLTSSISYLTVEKAGQAQTLGGTVAAQSYNIGLYGTGTGFTWNTVEANQGSGYGWFVTGSALGSSAVPATALAGRQNATWNLAMFGSSGFANNTTLTQGGTGGAYIDSTTVTFNTPSITLNTEGVHVRAGAAPSILGGTLDSNTNYSVYTEDLASRVTVTGATVSNNGLGADHAAGTADDSYTMRVSINSTTNTDAFSGNGKQGIELVGGGLTSNGRWYLPGTGTYQQYVLLNDTVVYNNSKLTIDAGVTVQALSNVGLIIGYYGYDYSQAGTNQEKGSIAINGTQALPVLLTSQSGATNGWKGLSLGPSTDFGGLISSLSYVTVEKAGQAFSLPGYAGTFNADMLVLNTGTNFPFDHVQTNSATGVGLYMAGSALTSTNGGATGNTGNGVNAVSSTLNLSGATITGNGANGVYLSATGGTISGNTISASAAYGLDTTGGAPTISGNTITTSGQYAIRYPIANAPVITGNTLTTNTKPGIEVVSGGLTTNHAWSLQNGETFFTVTGGDILVYNLAKLTVGGGSTVQFSSGTSLIIGYYNYDYSQAGTNQERGSLAVNGTAALPVLFTSKTGAAGGWKGLAFGAATDYSGLTSSISYLTVEKAGQAQTLGGTVASQSYNIGVYGTGAGFTWTNVEANQGSGYGWFVTGSALGSSAVPATALAGRQNATWNLAMFGSSGFSNNTTLTQGGTGGAYIDSTTVTFNTPSITLNTEGVHVRAGAAPSILGGTLDSNTNYSVYTEDLASRVTVTGATVSNNGLGADHAAGTADDSYTMRVSINSTTNTDAFSGNGKQGIELVGGGLTTNGRWYLPGTGTYQQYVLLNDTIVYNLAKLTIDAGVTVQALSNVALIIGYYGYDYSQAGTNQERGQIAINGTQALPVLLTSQSGATNGWKGLSLGPSTDYGGLTSSLSYVTVEKAGQALTLPGYAGTYNADILLAATGTNFPFDHVQTNSATGVGLYLSASALTSTNGGATGNTGNGIHAVGSTLNLSGATVATNGANGVYLSGTGGTISGGTFNANTGYAIDTTGGSPTISGNTISNSGQYAIRYPIGTAPTITNNTLTGDAKPGIEVVGGSLTTNHTWATQIGEPFFTVTGAEVVVYNLAKLTVAAGNTIKFSSGTGLIIGYYNYDYSQAGTNQERGQIAVNGTSASPVLFTAASGVPGAWKGVALGAATDYGGLLPSLNYLIIEKGGQAQTMGGTIAATSANLIMLGTTASINNVNVVQGSNTGIYSNGSTPNVRNSIVAYNAGAGLAAAGGAPSFTYGDVFGNGAANNGWTAGANSKAVDPQFTNYIGGDYRLNPGSPCIDAGTSATGLTYLGLAPDMGAVEYGAAINCANPSVPNGSPCNDGNACTQSDVCQNQQCVGSNPIVCVGSDQCHAAGLCNPATGACSNPAKTDGTACSDGNACTQTDTCQSGTCSGANPVTCTALDQCHSPGTCATATGVCSNPVIGTGVYTTYYRDFDADGHGNPAVTTQACGQPNGYVANANDCDDNAASVHPGAAEICDGLDNDCDGSVDENLYATYYLDADGDGYGSAATSVSACAKPNGYVANNTDCNDASATIHPGAAELCNNIDDNCNGVADEGNPGGAVACSTGLQGACSAGTTSCFNGSIVCAQTNVASNEVCDGVDNDCDGQTDEGVKTAFYRDLDGDGFGNAANSLTACSAPGGYVANSTDCNDSNASVHPGAGEVCDGLDNNCNGTVDEGAKITFYADADGDGYGSNAATIQACAAPAGYVGSNGDCNDASAAIHPGATDTCNGLDDNCNGQIDETSQTGLFYADGDGDGYGDPATGVGACIAPPGYIATAGDCDDAHASVHPGAVELCDGLDNNCNGTLDETLAASTFHKDADGDGYGDPALTLSACAAPPGYVANGTDCDDAVASVHPGAGELCDGLDNNCNNAVDEGNPGGNVACATGLLGACGNGATVCVSGAISCVQTTQPSAEACDGIDNDCNGQTDEGVLITFYKDADGDGYGTSAVTTQACTAPAGFVASSTDCNDLLASTHPGAAEICDGVDNSCDGQIDENNPGGNAACATGLQGACGAGTTVCSGGALSCLQTTAPSAETCDGVDNDCNGQVDDNNPGGNVACSTGLQGVCSAGLTVCNGGNITCHQTTQPSAESCDGLDNDCNGTVDDNNPGGNVACMTGLPGVCSTGTTACTAGALVCNQDFQATAELCDGVDNNCDGNVDEGNPGGNIACNTGLYGACAVGISSCGGGILHCAQTTFPANETCNGVDDNCDGQADEGLQLTYFLDADSDGYGTPNASIKSCTAPGGGYVLVAGDCDDANVNTHPGAAEACDGVDNDCNGQIDDGAAGGLATFYKDADGDGYGDPAQLVHACVMPAGYAPNGSDCDDAHATVHPGASEICDGLDNDCNGQDDENNPGGNLACATGLQGACAGGSTACLAGAIVCVQTNMPSAEICNGADDDCDGLTDENNPGGNVACVTGHPGVCNAGTTLCSNGALACAQSVQPSAETCDGLDNNCNGLVDDGNPGGGVACSTGLQGACGAGATACNGGSITCHQIAQPTAESCNGIDDDCDGLTDEGNPGGGVACSTGKFGSCSIGTSACSAGAITCTQTTFPAIETCNGLDDNCNGQIDEGLLTTYYKDSDGDQYGTPNGSVLACSQPPNYVVNSLDCDDTNANVHPSATELCNGLDDNCNGLVDEGGISSVTDCDHNGIADACQPDNDGDHIPVSCDNCPTTFNPSQNDSDGDGQGDACDRICVTIQRGLAGNIEDTQIGDDHTSPATATKNWGTSNAMNTGMVGGTSPRMSLLRFDLSPIPATAQVATASLKIFQGNVGNTGLATVNVHRITAPWGELTATWNNFNAAYDPQVLASFTNGGINYKGAVSVDLTGITQLWLSGMMVNNGILMEQSGTLLTNYWTSEYLPSLRPLLTVCYVIPG